MKKIFLSLLAFPLGFFSNAQNCANSINVYGFTYGLKNYEVVKELKTWAQAAACAVQRGGHLVHIDSLAEQTAVYNAIIVGAGVSPTYVSVNDGGGVAYVWIGATDKNVEGTWLWDGDGDNVGTNFWTGQGFAGANNGVVIGGAFVNWGGAGSGTFNEPDNYQNLQDGGAIGLASWPWGVAGEWNDINPANALYYVIEYENNTGVKEQGGDSDQLKLFPDPVKNNLSFSLPENNLQDHLVKILSVDGKIIIEKKLRGNENNIDVSILENGIYFIELISCENKVCFGKFVKE